MTQDQPLGGVLGLEQGLALRHGQRRDGGQRPGEVRRVAGERARVGVAPDVGERGPVGGERDPGPLQHRLGHRGLDVGARGDVADRERPGRVEPVELDPLQPDRDDVERAVGVRLDLGQLHPAADPVERLGAVVADLVALADPDRPEDPLGRVLDPQQVVHQRAVAVLEDGQRHAHAREQHRVEREHRQRVAHAINVARPAPCRRGRTPGVAARRIGPMIRRIDLRGAAAGSIDYRAAVPRADFDVEAAVPAVHAICEAGPHPRARRDPGVRREVRRRRPSTTSGSRPRRCRRRWPSSTPTSGPALEESIRRLRATCAHELEQDAVTDLGPGARVTHRKVPVGRVGLYVPGGLAPLVSSVLMNVVPAQTAGVESIALSSPPQKEFGGSVHPTILAACALLGVEEVYAVGGAQAIAMFAYGVGPCAKVDLVTGPGNIYTVTAKRLLKGQVGIDSEAGPTEIAILADDTADAAYVAADLVSQAEHDPLAAAVLVTAVRAAGRRGRGRAREAGRAPPSTPSGSGPACPAASPASCWSTTSSRASTSSTPTPPSTSRSTPTTPRRTPPGSATPARSSSASTPRSASATTAPAPTTCCPPAAAPATAAGCRCAPSPSRCTSSTTPARRSRRSPTTS